MRGNTHHLLRGTICISLLLSFHVCAEAEAKGAEYSSDNYCGLLTLYAAARLCGTEIEFVDLAKPEYCSSRSGSSVAELMLAARDHSLSAQCYENMTLHALRSAEAPLILNVKRYIGAPRTDHYVLYLGRLEGVPFVFDPASGARSLSWGELSSCWDGVALSVSSRPEGESMIVAQRIWQSLRYSVLLLILWLCVKLVVWCSAHSRTVLGVSVDSVALVACAALIGAVYHVASPDGFVRNPGALWQLECSQVASFTPKLDTRMVQDAMAEGAVVLDARLSHDYQEGHLPNAISIPINSTHQERLDQMRSVDRNALVVVYCQSASCAYDEAVAEWLYGNGFRRIAIYAGGWKEWNSAQLTLPKPN